MIEKAKESKDNSNCAFYHKDALAFEYKNAAHCAGIITKGYERKVIRFDFKHSSFEIKPSIIHRVLNNLFSKK